MSTVHRLGRRLTSLLTTDLSGRVFLRIFLQNANETESRIFELGGVVPTGRSLSDTHLNMMREFCDGHCDDQTKGRQFSPYYFINWPLSRMEGSFCLVADPAKEPSITASQRLHSVVFLNELDWAITVHLKQLLSESRT